MARNAARFTNSFRKSLTFLSIQTFDCAVYTINDLQEQITKRAVSRARTASASLHGCIHGVRETVRCFCKAWRKAKIQLRGSPTAPAALLKESIRLIFAELKIYGFRGLFIKRAAS